MAKKEDYLTTAPKKKETIIENENNFPNSKNMAGDSVDEHKLLEEANLIFSESEIKQQTENL
ncbi:hypothetical protein JMM81_14785 [Bacillus sp. V3B]|uniref:hypothetical protein n=1 Tax=Bacillus sp. V3B TaxID=2804915 RepID=UPI0021099753|nr:hypothetical protein [Bacillus sp. V3B]MCQ6276192.1 hypothetical protein [Bacillus sp. V3B]